MPPRLPDRYKLNVRVGVDGDVEEWLATDQRLERPVLIRFPGPDADHDRVEAFLASVRSPVGAIVTPPAVFLSVAADRRDGPAGATGRLAQREKRVHAAAPVSRRDLRRRRESPCLRTRPRSWS